MARHRNPPAPVAGRTRSAWLVPAVALALCTAARADLVVYAPGRTEPVCHVKGPIRGAWTIDTEHLAIGTDKPVVLRLSDCSQGAPLAEFATGEVDHDPGRSSVIDGQTLRNRADGAPLARLNGLATYGPGLAGLSAACVANPGHEGCAPIDIWQLSPGGALSSSTLAGHERVRAFYPAEGDMGVGGFTFVQDGTAWTLAAPSRSRQAIHLYSVPDGTWLETLAVEDPPDVEPGWRTCDAPLFDATGRLVTARCDLGMATWNRDTKAHALRPSPPDAEHWIEAVDRHPRLGIPVAAFGSAVAEWSVDAGWRPRFSLKGKANDIRGLTFEPDGDALWIHDAEAPTLRVRWPDGKVLDTGTPRDNPVGSVAFGPQGQVALGFNDAPYLRVRAPGAPEWLPDVSTSNPLAAFLPDGRLVYAAHDGICIGDAAAPCDRHFSMGTGFSHLAVSPDGRYVAVDPFHDGVRIIDLQGAMSPPTAATVRPRPEAIRDKSWTKSIAPAHLGPPFGLWSQVLRAPAIERRSAAPLLIWPGAPAAELSHARLSAAKGTGSLHHRGVDHALLLDPEARSWRNGLDGGALGVQTVAGWLGQAADPASPLPLWLNGVPVLDHPSKAAVWAIAANATGDSVVFADADGRVWLRSMGAEPGPSEVWQSPVRPQRVGSSPTGDRVWVVGTPVGRAHAPEPLKLEPDPSQHIETMDISELGAGVIAAWRGPADQVAVAPDGGFAVASGRGLICFDAQGAELIRARLPAPIEGLAFAGGTLWLAQAQATGLDVFDPRTGAVQRMGHMPEGLRMRTASLRAGPKGLALWQVATVALPGVSGAVVLRWSLIPANGTLPPDATQTEVRATPILFDATGGLPPDGEGANPWQLADLAPGERGASALLLRQSAPGGASWHLRDLPEAAGQHLDHTRSAIDADGQKLRALAPPTTTLSKALPLGAEAATTAMVRTGDAIWIASESRLLRVTDRGAVKQRVNTSDTERTGMDVAADGSVWLGADAGLVRHPPKGKAQTISLPALGVLSQPQALPDGTLLVRWKNDEHTGVARIRTTAD